MDQSLTGPLGICGREHTEDCCDGGGLSFLLATTACEFVTKNCKLKKLYSFGS